MDEIKLDLGLFILAGKTPTDFLAHLKDLDIKFEFSGWHVNINKDNLNLLRLVNKYKFESQTDHQHIFTVFKNY